MNAIVAQKINNQIKALVSSAVFDVFNDPDLRLELSARAKKRLSMSSKNSKTISLTQLRKKYL